MASPASRCCLDPRKISPSESTSASADNGHWSLRGQGGESALAFRDKVEMKSRLVGLTRRVRIPEFRPVHEAYDVIAFIERHGYPVSIKPIDGFASIGTTVIRGDGDLARLLSRRLGHGLEVERFIDGAQYHVDGLVLGGELVLCWPSRYLDNCLSFTRGGFTASHMQAFGVNITELFVRAQAGQAVDAAAVRERARAPRGLFGWGLVPPRPGVFEGYRQQSPDLPFVVSHEWMMSKGTRSRAATGSTDQIAGFIVNAEPEQSSGERLRAVWKWTCDNAIWAA